jgi:hypothetical protein
MNGERKGGDLFVVDNSDPGWTGLRYLQEWCDLASRLDIATGYFEVGSLLAPEGKTTSCRVMADTGRIEANARRVGRSSPRWNASSTIALVSTMATFVASRKA